MAKKTFDIPKESCAARLKKALSIRKMMQAELCQKTNIPKSALSEYLKGLYDPKQDRLVILSEALNVDPVWLMGFDVPMEKSDKKISPHEPTLTEGEKVMLELFRQIPVDQQPVVLAMIRAALCTDK
jgi:transcriptional regulator with XRE-family HTH domain